MNANNQLKRIREIVEDGSLTSIESYIELVELVNDLDYWLCRGGLLPEDWRPKGPVSGIRKTIAGARRTTQ